MRLFRMYPEGNFIEAGADTPYFQTGKTKYGKPIIERVITRSTLRMPRSVCWCRSTRPCAATCRSACRSTCCCTGATASKWRCGGGLTMAMNISPRSVANGAKAFDKCFATCRGWTGEEAPGGSQMSLPPIASPSVTLPPFAAACPPHWRRPPVRLPSQTVPPRSTGRR